MSDKTIDELRKAYKSIDDFSWETYVGKVYKAKLKENKMGDKTIRELVERLVYYPFDKFSDERNYKTEDEATEAIEARITEAMHEAWGSLHQNATCCEDKHQTFFGAVVSSPQWELWQKNQRKNPTRDLSEVEETGVMSDGHFQEFLKFCLTQLKENK